MSRILTVYCEGKSGSYDYDVLTKVVDGLTVQIVPIGGKRGARSIIQYREGQKKTKSDFYLFFRDRDFDVAVPTNPKLIKVTDYVFYSYRTTIENYLQDFDLFKAYSEDKSWTSDELENSFIQAAKDIKNFQAMRHTLGEMREKTDFGTNTMERSGILPDNLDEDACRQAGLKLIEGSVAKTKNWTKERYNDKYDKNLDLFDDAFHEDLSFLVYYQGKDFMKALCRRCPGLSPKDYYQFAISKFDYEAHSELKELRSMLEGAMNA